jgi:hypothetical protein
VSRPYVIVRHGKRIEVKDLELPTSARRSRRAIQDSFARVPLVWAADVAKATNTPGYLVLTLLVYLAWKAKSSTLVLSNDCLRQFGVDRKAKYRALTRLEKVGVISVRQDPGKATVVTLLGAWGETLLR